VTGVQTCALPILDIPFHCWFPRRNSLKLSVGFSRLGSRGMNLREIVHSDNMVGLLILRVFDFPKAGPLGLGVSQTSPPYLIP